MRVCKMGMATIAEVSLASSEPYRSNATLGCINRPPQLLNTLLDPIFPPPFKLYKDELSISNTFIEYTITQSIHLNIVIHRYELQAPA